MVLGWYRTNTINHLLLRFGTIFGACKPKRTDCKLKRTCKLWRTDCKLKRTELQKLYKTTLVFYKKAFGLHDVSICLHFVRQSVQS